MEKPGEPPSVCEIFESATISGDINFDHELRGEFKKGWGEGMRKGGGRGGMKGEKREGEGQTGRNPERGRGKGQKRGARTGTHRGALRSASAYFLKRLLKQNMFKLRALMGL